jgi:hypothetical protein
MMDSWDWGICWDCELEGGEEEVEEEEAADRGPLLEGIKWWWGGASVVRYGFMLEECGG